MPSLNWIGREAVERHHTTVPFHLLRADAKLSAGDPESGNLLVEGDNLLALKALLPYYAGQVKCIYIDPPYNTGNDFIYDDDFAENTEAYFERSNQKDEVGNRLIANNESNGRFHSDWLSTECVNDFETPS